jgi:hypothetical protein
MTSNSEPWTNPPSLQDIHNAYYFAIGLDLVRARRAGTTASELKLSEVTTVLDDTQLQMVERIVRILWSRRR